MTNHHQDKLDLSGDGAAYIRVSDDKQDVQRQYDAIHAFEKEHKVTIQDGYWFKDEGWARDTADYRPDFQRMIKLGEDGEIKWILVDKLDRFGTKSSKQLLHFLYCLEEAGCKLYDINGKEWTAADISTIITAVVEGHSASEEPHHLSHRVLSAKAGSARDGEWQGNRRVRLGFDVGCFSRSEPDKELWRVIIEGENKRLKVYPDGREERCDGKGNFPKHQATEMKRLVPSNDESKIKAVLSVFERYANESISLTALAHYLNNLGFRTCTGEPFQSTIIEDILTDPAYLGYPLWNRSSVGKFHEFTKDMTRFRLNTGKKQKRTVHAEEDQIRSSKRLFDPLVPFDLFDRVQVKLRQRDRQAKAPSSHRHHLSGMLYCAHCGQRMIAAGPAKRSRIEYICGTYQKHTKHKKREGCPCRRHPVFQDEIEPYIDRFLKETDQKIEVFLNQPADSPTEKLEKAEVDAWKGFTKGIRRLCDYLRKYHPQEYARILAEDAERRAADQAAMGPGSPPALGRGSLKRKYGQRLADAARKNVEAMKKDTFSIPVEQHDEFVGALLDAYRASPKKEDLSAKIEKLEAELAKKVRQFSNITHPTAIEEANKQLTELGARIEHLKGQQEDAIAVIETHYTEMLTLQEAIRSAQWSMKSDRGESALRQKAEALRRVIQRIECQFEDTGPTGRGNKGSRLEELRILPVVGDLVKYPAEAEVTGQLTPCSSDLPYRT